MKRQILISFLLLSFGTINCFAKAVDQQTAQTIGANYLIVNEIPGIKSSSDLTLAYTATAQINGAAIVDYYVFNFTSGPGFIIVTGDDNVIPVLAYSFQSYFNIDKMAPATKDWVEGYQNQITYALAHNLPAKEGTLEKWNDLMVAKKAPAARTTTVFPSNTAYLCQTTWDQEPVYNNLCPAGTPTGCVATAMAQVMKFWNWPTVGCGAHTYIPPSEPGQSADFGSTAYNWTSMNTSLTAANSAIETLMYHCGVAVEMQYSASESGAYVTESETPPPYVTSAEYALKTYFSYKRSLHGVLRDGTVNPYTGVISDLYYAFYVPSQAAYTGDAPWYDIIEAELNAGRPMLYKGQGSDGGHCWVCDGYNSTNFMHFNWGWSGLSDGWFSVDNLAPSALGAGGGSGNFNTDQGVLMGIVPDSFLNASGNIKLVTHVDCPDNDAYAFDAPISVTTTIQNSGSTAFNGSIAAQVFDTSDNYVATIETLTSQTLAAGATSSALVFSAPSGLLAMIPGQYNVRIMTEATGAKTWTAVNNNGVFINDNYIDVRNTGLGSGMELMATINITTGGINQVSGTAMTISTSVQNTLVGSFGSGNYNGAVQASLINVSTGTPYVIQNVPTSIASNNTNPYTFSTAHVTAPDGEYILAIQYKDRNTSAYDYVGGDYFENPIIVHVHTNVGVNNVANPTDIVVYPNPANDVVNISTQGVEVDHVTITDIQGRDLVQMNIDNGQSLINIPVSNFAPGIYLAQIHTAEGMVTKKIVINR